MHNNVRLVLKITGRSAQRNWPASAAKKHNAVGAVGLGFDSRGGQIGRSAANDLPPQGRSSELCCPGAKQRIWILPLVITPQRNGAGLFGKTDST